MSMELDNAFTVPTSPDHAWKVLLDVEGIAPCMPGATVEEFDGEVVTGRIKVKVGPVSLTYRGTAKFIERDADAQVVVLEAAGKETRGAGTASATVRATLEAEPSGNSTRVVMHTTMNVTGRPAQFGRGVIAEVGGKLIEKFAENLAQLIASGDGATAAASAHGALTGIGPSTGTGTGTETGPSTGTGTGTDGSTVAADGDPQDAGAQSGATTATAAASTAAAPPAPSGEDSLNLVRLAGPAILKRVIPVAAAVAAVAALALLGRRFRHLLRRG